MKVKVQLFASVREAADTSSVEVEVPICATVRDLRQALAATLPAAVEMLRRAAIAVNGEYALDSMPVAQDAEVAVIPPVSGG